MSGAQLINEEVSKMANKKCISIVTPCHDEEDNVGELARRVKGILDGLGKYDYEHIFIDNASCDKTVDILKGLAQNDPKIKIIINARNFGAVRSLYHGLIQASGDAAILIYSDLQDPPELIAEFIKEWERGANVVKGIKVSSEEQFLMYSIRSLYYFIVDKLSDVRLELHFTGFGLYDKKVIEALRAIDDPYPDLRGIIAEVGFKSAVVHYRQKCRKRGKSKMNFYGLYDYAMLGITSCCASPLRIASMFGFVGSFFSLLAGVGSLAAMFFLGPRFSVVSSFVAIAIFFLFFIGLFCMGVLCEYIGFMHVRILNRPRVIEKGRVNF